MGGRGARTGHRCVPGSAAAARPGHLGFPAADAARREQSQPGPGCGGGRLRHAGGVRLRRAVGRVRLSAGQHPGVRPARTRAGLPRSAGDRPQYVGAAPCPGVRGQHPDALWGLGRLGAAAGPPPGRARCLLVRLPGGLHLQGPEPAGLCRCVPGGELPGDRRDLAGHLGLAAPGPHRVHRHRQPAERDRRRLCLVRRGGAGAHAAVTHLVGWSAGL